MTQVKTVFLLTLLSGIFLALGYLFAGEVGLVIALVLAGVMNIGSYWYSDKLALRMSGAREVSAADEPRLHQIVDEVAAMARMPKPKVYVIQNDSPNAFATGRNQTHAAVAATTGIMRILDDRELTAVFGHELGHIRNRDILVSAIVATIATAIMFIAFMGRWAMIFGFGRSREGGIIGLVAMLAMIILAPIAATAVRFAISRQREYGADVAGAEITHMPMSLASALQKLEDYSNARPMQVNPAVSHLFIVNPFGDPDRKRRPTNETEDPMTAGFIGGNLFSSHPPTAKRIERLNEIARKTGNFS
jgi:heat shock protein HtpX